MCSLTLPFACPARLLQTVAHVSASQELVPRHKTLVKLLTCSCRMLSEWVDSTLKAAVRGRYGLDRMSLGDLLFVSSDMYLARPSARIRAMAAPLLAALGREQVATADAARQLVPAKSAAFIWCRLGFVLGLRLPQMPHISCIDSATVTLWVPNALLEKPAQNPELTLKLLHQGAVAVGLHLRLGDSALSNARKKNNVRYPLECAVPAPCCSWQFRCPCGSLCKCRAQHRPAHQCLPDATRRHHALGCTSTTETW